MTRIPRHMGSNLDRTEQDPAGYFPDLETAKQYAQSAVLSEYGQDRVRACKHLIGLMREASPAQERLSAVDFGIGDGVFLENLGLNLHNLYGIDTSESMLALAEGQMSDVKMVPLQGSVEQLAVIASDSIDLALCIDTEGYLEPKEVENLYEEFSRVVKPGGFLIVLNGNELFDFFALNSGTVNFFREHFSLDVEDLLVLSGTKKWSTAPRRNPLNFGSHLLNYGFIELAQSFSQWHEKIPSVLVESDGISLLEARLASRNHSTDPNELSPQDKWKAMFQCSLFGSLAQKASL